MAIILEHISKSFEKKVALNDISLSFSNGKIYALFGENGAGKSTIAKIISNRLQPTTGKIFFTINEKIKIVEQRPLIAESISVRQNILLGHKDNKENFSRLLELKKTWCPSLKLDSIAKNIGPNERFYASLLNCLLYDFDVLILDEPTAYLDDIERKNLYEQLKKLKEKNICVIVITHSKKEIIEYVDDIYLLKKGKLINAFCDIQKANDKNKIVDLITKSIFREGENSFKENKSNLKESIKLNSNFFLEAKNLNYRPIDKPLISNISFKVESGQIVMINGLSESGLLTLEDCLTGMNCNLDIGEIVFYKDNRKCVVKKVNPLFLRKELIKKNGFKIGIVPSNKNIRGSNPEITIFQTIFPFVDKKDFFKLNSIVKKIIDNAKIDATQNDKIKSLSGGMLQRLILERELFFNPDLLILCEPFAGLDMEKIKNISNKIIQLNQEGKAVLILSSEKNLFELCHKVYRLEGGKFL